MSDEPDVRQLTNVIRPASPERRPPEKLKLPRALHAGTITTMPSEARTVDKPKSPDGYKSIVAPVFDPINLQCTIVTGFLWIVRADDLDKFPIARTALISHYHFVVGAILRSLSA